MTTTKKTPNQLLATLTDAQCEQVQAWAKDWLPELRAMSRVAPDKYRAALCGVILQIKRGRIPERRFN